MHDGIVAVCAALNACICMHGPICRARAGQHICRMRHAPNKSTRTASPVRSSAQPLRAEDERKQARRQGPAGLAEICIESRRQGRHTTRERTRERRGGTGGSVACDARGRPAAVRDRTCVPAEAATGCRVRAPTGVPPRGRGGGRRQSSREQGHGGAAWGGVARRTRVRAPGAGARGVAHRMARAAAS